MNINGNTNETLHRTVASIHKNTPGFMSILHVLNSAASSSLLFTSFSSLLFASVAYNIKYFNTKTAIKIYTFDKIKNQSVKIKAENIYLVPQNKIS